MGLVLGPHARTNRTRDTRAAQPRLPDTKRPSQGIQATGTVLGPIPAHACPQHVDSGP